MYRNVTKRLRDDCLGRVYNQAAMSNAKCADKRSLSANDAADSH